MANCTYCFGFFIKNDKLTVIVTLTILILLILALSINTSQILFIILVIIATFFTGPLQSSSRVIMANLTDDNRQGFSFGIFTLSGKTS